MDPAGWFVDGFTVQSQSGSSSGGDPTWGAKRAIAGSLRTVQRRDVTAAGTALRVVSVFVTDQVILPTDRIWLPGADTSNDGQAQRFAPGTVRSAHSKDGGFTLYQGDLG